MPVLPRMVFGREIEFDSGSESISERRGEMGESAGRRWERQKKKTNFATGLTMGGELDCK